MRSTWLPLACTVFFCACAASSDAIPDTGEPEPQDDTGLDPNPPGPFPEDTAPATDTAVADTAQADTSAPIEIVPPKSPTASYVHVSGYQLIVARRKAGGGFEPAAPYTIKGVSWSPTGVGETNTEGYYKYYTKYTPTDLPLMVDLGANTVKTYDAFELSQGKALLDQFHAKGIMVIMSVFVWDGAAANKAYLNAVKAFKDHPAILMWLVGNEFNYNMLYSNPKISLTTAIAHINTAIDDIHAADPDHPVFVGFGEVPSTANYNAIPKADGWSINLYPTLDLTSRFTRWTTLSTKPMFVGEYGADAFDNRSGQENQDAQAKGTETLTKQIQARYSSRNAANPVLGGTIYVLSDEWWKDGNPGSQENGGFNVGVYPDGFANEEWWGLTDIHRVPRKAFQTLKALYAAP